MSVRTLLHEHEADRAAAHASRSAGGCGCKCAACAKKAGREPRPLEPAVRAPFERAFATNLDAVRVREDTAATRLGASAFAQGHDIAFAPGRYRPDTPEGQQLLGHEIAHTLQQRPNPAFGLTAAPHGVIQRNGDGPAVDPAAVFAAVDAISHAVETDDVGSAVPPLRERTLDERKLIRTGVHDRTHQWLEHWFVGKMNEASTEDTLTGVIVGTLLLPLGGVLIAGGGARAVSRSDPRDPIRNGTAEEGVRRMWRAAPLIDRLEVYDEGFREIEQAQLDVIRSSSGEERSAAVATAEARLDAVLSHMSGREEYECRKLIYTDETGKWNTAKRMLKVGDEDPLFDAILDLRPGERLRFRDEHRDALESEIGPSDFRILNAMVDGDEVDALLARLERATDWRLDDAEGIGSVIDRAVALLSERRQLEADINGRTLAPEALRLAQARVLALDRLAERLLAFSRVDGGELEAGGFLARIAAARGDAGAFAADAQRLAEFVPPAQAEAFAFEIAKQRILIAGADMEAIRAAIANLHASRTAADGSLRSESAQHRADVEIRERLTRDDAVRHVIENLTGFAEMQIDLAIQWDRFDEVHQELTDAFNNAQWGAFFHHVLVIARNPGWRERFRNTATVLLSTYSRVHDPERTLMEQILESQHMPLLGLLDYTGNVETLRAAFDDINEDDRAALRLGWYLRTQIPVGPAPSEREANALALYDAFAARLQVSQTTAWVFHDERGEQSVLATTLGPEPTRDEIATPEGRYRTAFFWHSQIEARLRLERGVATHFSETDETMVAAAREFEALWAEVEGRGALNMIDFSALAALQQRAETRSGEFEEANNAISEMAGIVAATVAGLVVVAATDGVALPAVIAWAAAAGGSARIVTREMFGGDYYAALSDDGLRDVLLGAIDAALAVVGGQLATRGAELLGLGGRALTSGVARMAGQVAEHATEPLRRRVLASAVEAAIDGLFSGTISEGFAALTDDRTWRRGIMNGLARVGQAALFGGLAGLGGGVLVGGLLPVLGAGGRWAVGAFRGGRSLESTLERAGASRVLSEARAAASAGRIEEANALAARLEEHLSEQEALALRREIGDELRRVLPDPPGRGTVSEAERALLDETRTIDAPTGAHLDNETAVVRRSEPQPSREPGYVDEVDLGNGHTWRRAEDGRWCRFTQPTLCVPDIPGARPPGPTAREARRAADRQRAATARAALQSAELTQANETMLQNTLWEIYNKVRRAPLPGPPPRIDPSLLTDEESDLLRALFDTNQPPFPLLRDAADPDDATELLRRLAGQTDAAARRAITAQQPLAARLRSAIRTKMDRIRNAARFVDQLSGVRVASLEVDHIVPFSEIMDMPGFMALRWEDQVFLQGFDANVKAIDEVINQARNSRSWTNPSWLPPDHVYSVEQLAEIAREETRLRGVIQAEIDRRLGGAAR